jgi:hypothetical protein
MGMDSAAVQGGPFGRLTSLAELTDATLPASGGLGEDSVMDDKALRDHLLGLTSPWTDTVDAGPGSDRGLRSVDLTMLQ